MLLKIESFGNRFELMNKYRLYPVVVPNPETTYKILNARGIDAYMGVT